MSSVAKETHLLIEKQKNNGETWKLIIYNIWNLRCGMRPIKWNRKKFRIQKLRKMVIIPKQKFPKTLNDDYFFKFFPGQIGIVLESFYFEPANGTRANAEAQERILQFNVTNQPLTATLKNLPPRYVTYSADRHLRPTDIRQILPRHRSRPHPQQEPNGGLPAFATTSVDRRGSGSGERHQRLPRFEPLHHVARRRPTGSRIRRTELLQGLVCYLSVYVRLYCAQT